MKWEHKGHEFDCLKDFDFKNNTYCIWGAGTYGIAFYEEMKDKLNITKFIDSKEILQGSIVCSLEVISPEDFFESYNGEIVIVSTGWTNSVYSQLNGRGFVRYKEYFHIDEIKALYMFFEFNKVCISDLPIGITQCCTLHCEYCNAFIPLLKKPISFPAEQIMDDIDCVMKWVDEISILGMVGGDAMIHPKFREILCYICENYYPERIHNIEVYSNAVIVPDEEDINLFKKYKVVYRFTDYSGMSGKQNIDEVIKILKENNIMYDHARFDAWFDCGYPQESNGIKTEEGLREFCTACDRKTCHDVRKGKFYTCGLCLSADDIGYCQVDERDYFDLTKYDPHRKAEFLEYYLGYSERGYYSYCKMCNGGINVNSHKVEVGKQI